jgi:hypothetical protein
MEMVEIPFLLSLPGVRRTLFVNSREINVKSAIANLSVSLMLLSMFMQGRS